jgi:tRNA nucleotidyltransferase (CCA-adding enzyme)
MAIIIFPYFKSMGMLSRIKPSREEEERLKAVADELIGKIEKETENIDSRIRPALLGSASRNTWLKDEKDLDIFVVFPPEYRKRKLEEVVTEIGKRLLQRPEKRYAEHPYIKGLYQDFDVEIVPCYAVESPEKLKSAVDRTPFHDRFVKENIPGKEDEVRLLKQFLKGIGCYGAEAKVEGVSGYLAELLVIKYGSFERVLEEAAGWKPRQVLWVGKRPKVGELRKKFPSPLIFLDPVDRNRNVASALSEKKFSEFVYAAKEYLKEPKKEFFFPRKRKAERDEVEEKFRQRGTEILALLFSRPRVVEDILYPQLRKAVGTLRTQLEDKDFSIIGIDFFVRDRVCILIEMQSLEIPEARLHLGPRVNSGHEGRFLKKYEDYEGKLTEPFIEGDRWCIFLKRRHANAKTFLNDFLSERDLERKGMPKYIAMSLRKGFEVEVNEAAILEEFLPDLQRYFDPVFPWAV